MTLSEPTWAVVATVDEPLAVVQTFVAWHLSLGAAHVYLYCDRPNDPVQAAVAHLPRVSVVICDDAHWLRIGKSRPRRHQVRQVANYLGAPSHLVNKAPTADLESLTPQKSDEQALGMSYEQIDDFLEGHPVDPATSKRLVEIFEKTQHKRIPIPTIYD